MDARNNPDVIAQTETPTAVQCSALLACPWCDSEKVMAEGTDTRMWLVCQKCLARGPEVNVSEGRMAAVQEWNKALRKPPTPSHRHKCLNCGLYVAHVWYGASKRFTWKHIGIRGKRNTCAGIKVGQANGKISEDAGRKDT